MKTGTLATGLGLLLLFIGVSHGAAASKRPSLPATTVQTLAGQSWSASTQRGQVMVLHFWSLNCRPCLAVLPRLRRLQGAWKDGGKVSLVSLPVEDDLVAIRRHVKRHRMSWTQLVTEKGSALSVLAGPLGVTQMSTPYFWIVDKKGLIKGATPNPEEARKIAESLLNEANSVDAEP